MHPQAVIVDATSSEEVYFLAAMREQIKYSRASLIEVPDHSGKRLGWINKLDSSSLRGKILKLCEILPYSLLTQTAWDDVHVEILIHVPPGATSNLRRLLRSLARADLSALATPHITIELPSTVDENTSRFLAEYQWPPNRKGRHNNAMTIRRRVSRAKFTEEESAARLIDGFWPLEPSRSHVLVLSANSEVGPNFFNCKQK